MEYRSIVEHYENCYKVNGDNYKGVDWPNEHDVQKRYQVMLDLIKYDELRKENENEVLDFGCGLGHLYEYIRENNLEVKYTGLDLSPIFVNKCKEKYPEVEFIQKDILEDTCENNEFDYIIMNGVLTEKRDLKYEEMLDYFKELVKKVYSWCRKGIGFNVMSKDVDWERDDLFHLPLNTLSEFLCKEITRDFIIRYDYGLYEYTVYVYKRQK